MNASISVVCYKSKTLSNGEHPLMLQILNNKRIINFEKKRNKLLT
jgi:hypothetical protein